MTFETVVGEMLKALPELQPAMDEDFAGYGDIPPEPYTAFADVLRPAAYAALDAGEEAAARRYFNFYERVAADPDERVNALAYIELLEVLCEDPCRLPKAWHYMGQATKRAARKHVAAIKRQFGKEVWLPE